MAKQRSPRGPANQKAMATSDFQNASRDQAPGKTLCPLEVDQTQKPWPLVIFKKSWRK